MSRPAVDEEDVRHVAELARVELSAKDVERFRSEFVDILGYFDRLEEVPDVEPADDQDTVLRPDEIHDSLDQSEALRNAEDTEDGFFKGPPVS